MARTKASVGAKVNVGKSSKARAAAPPPPPPSSAGTKGGGGGWTSSGGGNPVCPRETPAWQLPITRFFGQAVQKKEHSDAEDDEVAGSSKSCRKKCIIESDDDAEMTDVETVAHVEPIAGKKTPIFDQNESMVDQSILDDSVELQPLNGESSHKIAEYFPTYSKNKDTGGKKTKLSLEDKENREFSARRNSKRDLEEDMDFNDRKKMKMSV